jgi:hypothetical protein
MASFPRDIAVQQPGPFGMPGALQSWSQSGKGQHRATAQVGRIWTETLVPFQLGSAAGRKLVAFLNNVWRNGTQYDVDHPVFSTPNGGGTGNPQINGASQTGSSLSTKLWTGSNPVLKAGDIISIAGISHVFDITADAPNLAGGITTLSINPPIFAGGSPANSAAITYTAVRLNAFLHSFPNLPNASPDTYIAGLSITHREAV